MTVVTVIKNILFFNLLVDENRTCESGFSVKKIIVFLKSNIKLI